MGYLSPVETEELRLPSNSEFHVRMKKRASYGDNRKAQSAMLKVSADQNANSQNGGGQMVAEAEVGAYLGTLTVCLIVDWNVTDEADRPLPITLENLDRLDPEDGDFLATEAQKRVGRRTPEEQGPFGKASGRPSTVTPSRTRKSQG